MFGNFDNVWWLGFAGFIMYYNRKKIPYIMNDIYRKAYNFKNNLIIQKGFSKKPKYTFIEDICVAEYLYDSDKYIIINKSIEDIKYPPYTMECIQKHNIDNLYNMVKSKQDIISAELVYQIDENKLATDVLKIVQKICGPLVNYYKNTINVVEKETLSKFMTNHLIDLHNIDNRYKHNIVINSVNIMTCDGDEFDLLKI
tara:strand:+ start:2060 stop:2656 length:597 start_codon:yes stop_codon:yes gene_type:complete